MRKVLAAAACLLAMAGCGAGTPVGAVSSASVSSHVVGAQGDASASAWDAEMDRVADMVDLPEVREILADHVITEAELAALQDRLADCLAPIGITEITFDLQEGGYSTNRPPGDADALYEAEEECERQVGYGYVNGLYSEMKRNPDNVDKTSEVVACLAAKGLVPPDYSPEAYRRDVGTGGLPFDIGENADAFTECASLG